MEGMHSVAVVWRGNKYIVEMMPDASVKDLGDELQKLTDVKTDTMRFIVPQSKGSKLLSPFSDEHSQLSLNEVYITEGKTIRMMGVSEDEVDKVLQNAKVDQRIVGFDEEEKRMRQRMSYKPRDTRLPQGPYIFCDFRTLELPGIELNPPASEALKRMHRLAADPGIVAIMNKHKWSVGIMTELAPVGYVGVSPKCILGFNKNHGEEISLRLRTDDLKGFRKYESIKKTLLHELAHMVYSEHDANFYALDKQLNLEANSLDWTKARGHTLSGVRNQDYDEEDFDFIDNRGSSYKLGGNVLDLPASARASSVAAAYRRFANVYANSAGETEIHQEPDPDDSRLSMQGKDDAMKCTGKENIHMDSSNKAEKKHDPYESLCGQNKYEPDPDDSQGSNRGILNKYEPDPDDSQGNHNQSWQIPSKCEPDPDDSQDYKCQAKESLDRDIQLSNTIDEPDPDDTENGNIRNFVESMDAESMENFTYSSKAYEEPDPDDGIMPSPEISNMQLDEPDPDDQELQRIRDPVTILCGRLQKAIKMLRSEGSTTEATASLQTLLKIIRNVIEKPDEMKFKRLRKANPVIQKNIVGHKGAMEILQMVGFSEEAAFDELGRSEIDLVLKRNDPGLLWLAKSTIESSIV